MLGSSGIARTSALGGNGDELMFTRSDGSILVQAEEFEKLAIVEELKKDLPNTLSEKGYQRNVTVPMGSPRYYGERLYVSVTNGNSEGLALVDTLEVTARASATNRADMNLTETGDYGGNIFATGVAAIGDSEARFRGN
jgi:hypothetical protein